VCFFYLNSTDLSVPAEALSAQFYIIIINKLRQMCFGMSHSGWQGGRYEGWRGHGKGDKRSTVELGEELEVDIIELSPKGEGLARIQGLVVYVADAKPGDHVKIKITKISSRNAEAQITK